MKKKISDADSAALSEIYRQVQDAEKDLQAKRDAYYQLIEDYLSDGYSLKSIAGLLGMSQPALHRAVSRFRARSE